jgi:histidyl-tRNA synthetase
MHAGGGSMKSQFKKADASGARYALIFGDDEVARGEVSLKDLRNADAPQRSLPLDGAAGWATELLNA